jgi:hypothetical protein
MRNPFRRRRTNEELARMLCGLVCGGGLIQWPEVANDLSVVTGEPGADFANSLDVGWNFGLATLALCTLAVERMRFFGRERRIVALVPTIFLDSQLAPGAATSAERYQHFRAAASTDGFRGKPTLEAMARSFLDYLETAGEPTGGRRNLQSPAARSVIERALTELTDRWDLGLAHAAIDQAEALERQQSEETPR